MRNLFVFFSLSSLFLLSNAMFIDPGKSGALELVLKVESSQTTQIAVNSNVTSIDLHTNSTHYIEYREMDFRGIISIRLQTKFMKSRYGSRNWHMVVFDPLQGIINVDQLPRPFDGMVVKVKCERNWFGEYCDKYCDEDAAHLVGMRCNKKGVMGCNEGFCGPNCDQTKSQCSMMCACENDAPCYSSTDPRTSREYVYCECLTGFEGKYCQNVTFPPEMPKFRTVMLGANGKIFKVLENKNLVKNEFYWANSSAKFELLAENAENFPAPESFWQLAREFLEDLFSETDPWTPVIFIGIFGLFLVFHCQAVDVESSKKLIVFDV